MIIAHTVDDPRAAAHIHRFLCPLGNLRIIRKLRRRYGLERNVLPNQITVHNHADFLTTDGAFRFKHGIRNAYNDSAARSPADIARIIGVLRNVHKTRGASLCRVDIFHPAKNRHKHTAGHR